MAGPSSRHYEFAREYAKGSTIYDAAVKAGFSEQTAKKHAFKWLGKTRSDSMYPEIWDLVQKIREEAKDETVDEAQELKEWLRKVWETGTMDIDLGDGIKMPKAVQEQSRLKAADTYLKMLPAQVQKSEVTIKDSEEDDYSNLDQQERFKLLELMRKAKAKKE